MRVPTHGLVNIMGHPTSIYGIMEEMTLIYYPNFISYKSQLTISHKYILTTMSIS